MPRLRVTLATIAIALACNTCWAQLYPSPGINPYTNPLDPLDVDDNGLVQAKDVQLVINRLENQADAKAANTDYAAAAATLAQTATTRQYYWDTNRDGVLTPDDALLVINSLSQIPEPSTIVLAGLGLLALVGCAWRKRLSIERQIG